MNPPEMHAHQFMTDENLEGPDTGECDLCHGSGWEHGAFHIGELRYPHTELCERHAKDLEKQGLARFDHDWRMFVADRDERLRQAHKARVAAGRST